MSPKPFHYISTVLLWTLLLVLPGRSQTRDTVKTAGDLARLATKIGNSLTPGAHVVAFKFYGNPGQFKLDAPSATIESITLQRSSPDSIGVLRPTDNLPMFDIKGLKGTLILKGLAFHLPNKRSRLIAGAEAGRENGSLILDNCFIYADSLDGPFLGWLAGVGGKIEIRNSYIVTKTGYATARMNLAAPEVALSNNLFNFAGGIEASVSLRLDVSSNNLNKTQFNVRTENFGVPTFHFTRNFIAHRPETNAFGAGLPWVLYHSGFDAGISTVLLNKLYKTWPGFDYETNGKWDATPNSNVKIDTIIGKSSKEAWNWYVDAYDTEAGMLTGALSQPKYNVMPESSSHTWSTSLGNVTAVFRTALFPRMIKFDTAERAPALESPSLRNVHTKGILHFGPFEIESIRIDARASYGQPMLLANDSTGKFVLQSAGSAIDARPSVFPNGILTARRFILAENCNTPRGASVRPGAGSLLNTNDKLVFAKVDTAGRTIVSEDQTEYTFPKNIRKLGNIQFATTAAVSGTVAFGLQSVATNAHWADKIQWFVTRADTTIQEPPMVRRDTGADAGKYTGTANYTSQNGSPFSAFLVENLTVPREGKDFVIADGSVEAKSAQGYQLKIDSTPPLDTADYLLGSKGYRFTWAGRVGADSLFLALKPKPNVAANPDMEAFVKVGTSAPQPMADIAKDSLGVFRIPIAMVDSGKTFFLGMKYNIKATLVYNMAEFDSVVISKFSSATSGKLDFAPITASMVSNRLGAFGDSARFLAGIKMIATNLTVAAGWGANFSARGFFDSSRVDAYYFDGTTWKPLEGGYDYLSPQYQVKGIPASASEIILVEWLPPVSRSVETDTLITQDSLVVSTKYTDPLNRRITHFCVEVASMDSSGKVETYSCAENTHPIQSKKVNILLLPNRAYTHKIQYLEGNKPYVTAASLPLPDRSWDKALAVPADAKVKDRFRWHLVGFPIKSAWDRVLIHQKDSDVDSVEDSTRVYSVIRINDDSTAFIRVPDLKAEFPPGKAFLFAAGRDYHLQMDDSADFLPLESYPVPVEMGWNFIANPFPTAFPLSRFSFPGPSDRFRELHRIEKDNYEWRRLSSVLEKFTGYAYYSDSKGTLEFDPLAPEASSAPAAKASAGDRPARRIAARLQTQWGSSEAVLTSEARAIDIPFLPVPGSSPQLRMGGGKGLMVKAIRDGAAIDEIMEIRSPHAGRGSFRLETSGFGFEAVRLIHLASGKVFEGAATADLPLAKGSQTFRLLAGDQAFVRAGTESVLAGAPQDIGLSQNFPNPFRGKTRVALDWPAWDGGVRRAVLEVVDMQGRAKSRMDLGDIRMGRQVVTVDASGWRPGIYLYRLTVETGGKKARLQKRMLVSP